MDDVKTADSFELFGEIIYLRDNSVSDNIKTAIENNIFTYDTSTGFWTQGGNA